MRRLIFLFLAVGLSESEDLETVVDASKREVDLISSQSQTSICNGIFISPLIVITGNKKDCALSHRVRQPLPFQLLSAYAM